MPFLSILEENKQYLAETQAFWLQCFGEVSLFYFYLFNFGRTKIRLFIFEIAFLFMLHFLPVFLQIFGFLYEENDDIYLYFFQSHTT